MRCPKCSFEDTRVIDSRQLSDSTSVRRRRKCESCEHRFTTYEKAEGHLPFVAKRDGRREPFKREKILDGLTKAFEKRRIETAAIQDLVDRLESEMIQSKKKEWKTDEVGSFLMELIKEIDPVAYVRFASFYWDYQDIEGFVQGLKRSENLSANRENYEQ